MLNDLTFNQKLLWVQRMAPITQLVLDKIVGDFSKHRLVYAGHLDYKIVPQIEFFLKSGLEIHLSPCVPGIIFEDCLHYLATKGAKIYGSEAKSWKDLERIWEEMLSTKPHFIFDIGGGVIKQATNKKLSIVAASEATGTGVKNLSNEKLPFPVFNWNDIAYKNIIHNRYDVGSGVWYSFRSITGLDLCRLYVVVIGFGAVGQSVASIAKGLGARVIVCEKDPLLRVVAASDGYITADLEDVVGMADVIATATGQKSVITKSNLKSAKEGLFLLNAGHDSREIDLTPLEPVEAIGPHIESYKISGKIIYFLAKGALLNLVTGGSSLNTFDYITALIARVIQFMIEEGKEYKPGLQNLPKEVISDLLEIAGQEANRIKVV